MQGGITRGARAALVLIAVLAVAILVLALLPSSSFGKSRCHTVRQCRHALSWQKKDRHHLERKLAVAMRHGLSLGYIARVGAAISGHAPGEFLDVGHCESTDNVTSQEYGFNGATGWLQYQWGTWKGTSVYRWFGDGRKDPLLETIAAALYLAHGGHWGGPWAASRSCHHLR